MKKVKFRHSAARLLFFSVSLFLSFNTFVFAQESELSDGQEPQTVEEVQGPQESNVEATPSGGDAAQGKNLFNSLCAACHKLDANSIGPPLRGVSERRSEDWLHRWISNSQALIAAGDQQAVEIYNEYNQVAMPPFPQLSDEDIDNILAYVNQPKQVPQQQQVGGDGAAAGGGGGVSTDIILGLLAFILLMLLVILYLVNKTLRRFATASGVQLPVKQKGTPIWKSFVQNQFLVFVTAVILLLVGGYYIYGFFMNIGIDQGYQPVQPIHFSHKIHAGDNGIECRFCHSSARVSKTSGIPSLNVCMNCHKSIGEVAEETGTAEYSKEFYDREIQKLYAAVGWDAASQAYTGETTPVKWIRVHNLPDFAYFNHSQHVEVGGIACQTCHGPIEEMEIVYQHSPLTMGWCVNCHRETNVRMEGNEYYEKIHAELQKKYNVEELTVSQMGGIECAKCHY